MSEDSIDNGEVSEDAAASVESMVAESSEATQRPDNVPEKFWDAEAGSVRTDDVLKSYTALEGRFGSFTGAEKEYAAAFSDELVEAGISLDSEDPMIEPAIEFAKEMEMNQEGFSKMVNLYGMVELAKHNAQKEADAADIASLGDNAERRINNMSQWANKNMPGDLVEGFKDMAVSADAIKAMEQMISMTRSAPVEASGAAPSPGITSAEVHKMQFEKDEHGNRRIATDPSFKAEYEKKRNMVFGEEPHRQVVG